MSYSDYRTISVSRKDDKRVAPHDPGQVTVGFEKQLHRASSNPLEDKDYSLTNTRSAAHNVPAVRSLPHYDVTKTLESLQSANESLVDYHDFMMVQDVDGSACIDKEREAHMPSSSTCTEGDTLDRLILKTTGLLASKQSSLQAWCSESTDNDVAVYDSDDNAAPNFGSYDSAVPGNTHSTKHAITRVPTKLPTGKPETDSWASMMTYTKEALLQLHLKNVGSRNCTVAIGEGSDALSFCWSGCGRAYDDLMDLRYTENENMASYLTNNIRDAKNALTEVVPRLRRWHGAAEAVVLLLRATTWPWVQTATDSLRGDYDAEDTTVLPNVMSGSGAQWETALKNVRARRLIDGSIIHGRSIEWYVADALRFTVGLYNRDGESLRIKAPITGDYEVYEKGRMDRVKQAAELHDIDDGKLNLSISANAPTGTVSTSAGFENFLKAWYAGLTHKEINKILREQEKEAVRVLQAKRTKAHNELYDPTMQSGGPGKMVIVDSAISRMYSVESAALSSHDIIGVTHHLSRLGHDKKLYDETQKALDAHTRDGAAVHVVFEYAAGICSISSQQPNNIDWQNYAGYRETEGTYEFSRVMRNVGMTGGCYQFPTNGNRHAQGFAATTLLATIVGNIVQSGASDATLLLRLPGVHILEGNLHDEQRKKFRLLHRVAMPQKGPPIILTRKQRVKFDVYFNVHDFEQLTSRVLTG